MEGNGKRVVVIGGGVAGSMIAKTLQFTADVTLIDPKDYFDITWARLRNMVEPSFAEKSVIYHKDYFTNGEIITASAVKVTETEVFTSDGRQVPYDYLAIATGVADPLPERRPERLSQFQNDYEIIKTASSILIVGGGPTGVELASEITVDFPEKKVTLVHSGTRLLEFIGEKASTKALDWLIKNRVDVRLNQRVDLKNVEDNGGCKIYSTTSGEKIEADCHFVCIANPLGTAWIKETFLKNSLDSQGRLMVDENLRIKGRSNIYALGDITDTPELKQGHVAKDHGLIAAKNIKIQIDGGKQSKMATHKTGGSFAAISLGRNTALAQLPFGTFIGTILGRLKSRNLFVGHTRQDLGLKA